ncbi:amidase signature domain-containing protein [Plectosphaerella plurivora]|uniref:Amidase signature domain-containing protein n=1 Tax=Plectosphaerella plurivora TaxID=936078 RepID=A0A9P8VKR6_9PEZI|nr:amidase signature domain-containing protein [Plectosphaerella plurivora]
MSHPPATTTPADGKQWKNQAAVAQNRRVASLAKVQPPLEGIPDTLPLNSQGLAKAVLTAREIEITEGFSVPELLAALRDRAIRVEEVTRAFLRRAALAHMATNCLAELLWEEAIERARYLDSFPTPRGALFGLPISTKEHHGMVCKDVRTCGSYASWVDKPHGSNLLYDTLWDAGCVFFARTTQPQTIMHLETESNVYGRTVNPYNRNLTPGGSTGGEAALLGMRGSLLGVGGDIGGSVRCPAAHVGVYGFKPTNRRISVFGQRSHMVGKEAIMGTPGPMCVDRASLDLLMNVAIAARPWRVDPSLSVKEWAPFELKAPLKITVQWWDVVVMPHPPMTRALKTVSEACRRAGMTVVNWDSKRLDHARAWEILSSFYWPDGGKEVLGLLRDADEPLPPLTTFIIHEQPSVRELTQHELWQRCSERDEYWAMYAKAWREMAHDDGREVDVMLCPPSFGAATPHGQSRYWGYTSKWNLLDYPAVVFPVTAVNAEMDKKQEDYVPVNEQDQSVYDMYEPEKYAYATVSLQIVGLREHDEKVLGVLEEIEKAMGRS